MNITPVAPGDALWPAVQDYAEACSWRAGKALARLMAEGGLTGWERVIAACDGDRICGFCTAAATDCLPDAPYTPYIGYLFVDEAYRGDRLSERLIRRAMAYLKEQGFQAVYLVSDHVNLYEKYGFRVIDRRAAPWGSEEKIYMHPLD